MKKTMLAILMLIITCATTNLYAEIYTINNKFYSPKPYYYTKWYYATSSLYLQFIYITEDNKTYLRIKRNVSDYASIGTDDYIVVIFEDGKEYRLDYCTELSHNGKFLEIEAMCKINDFTNVDKIICVKNGYYYDYSTSISESKNTELLKGYNKLILEIEKLKE